MFSLTAYEALHDGVALVRCADRGFLRLTGADRLTWLQGLITNDVQALRPGHRLYAAWLTPQGRMTTDLWLVEAGEALVLDVPATLVASLAQRLDELVFAEDVRIDDVSRSMAGTLVIGLPDAVRSALHLPADGPVVAAWDDTYRRPALAVYGGVEAPAGVPGLAEALAGAPWVDAETFDVFRVESGVPAFLVDMTSDTIPLEAGIEDRAVSFTKGCYVGQEIIVRVTTRGGGRVARKLVGLTLDTPADAAPGPGATLSAGGRAVGHLTSVVWSPRCGSVIGLGYVHRDSVPAGTRLEVSHGAQQVSAVVTPLPFVAAAV